MSTYHWYNKDTFKLDELVMYGSSRLGTIGTNQYLTDTITRDSAWWAAHLIFTNPLCDSITYDATGLKQYEFTNHLGNVLVTLTDKHIPFYFPNFTYYYPEVASAQDYYPFGMIMPGRNYRDSVFRFGFNGQEKDNEVYGVGDAMTADFWEYDPRLGRRWNTDPVMKPWESSYSSFRNAPILFADPHGDDVTDPNGKNVTAGETIGQSDDKRTLYNSPNTNGNWDHATWNDKDGVYDFHYTNKKDEPSESSKPAEAKEPINATPPITNIGCHPDNTYLHVEAHNVYEYNKKLYTSLDFEHGQFAPSRNRLLDVLFGERTTSDGKALKSDGYINPYPILELTLDDGNPLMPGGIREFPEGAFSIVDWEGYPDGIPKPQGPFVLLEKQDWEIARKLADNANKALHRANPALDGLHIHEIHPVKFGGNPTSLANKTFLSPAEHRKLNTFWYNLQRSIQKKL